MKFEITTIIISIISVIIGATIPIITTLLNGRNSYRIQEKAEIFKRESDFRIFQKNNLLSLQEKISDTMRLLGKIHIEDLKYFEQRSTWNNFELSKELNEELSSSFRQLGILIERIEIDELRFRIKHLREQMGEYLLSNTLDDAEFKIKRVMDSCDEILSEIGDSLRNYYKVQ